MKKDFETRLTNDLFPEMPQSFADGLQNVLTEAGAEPRRINYRFLFTGVAAAVLVAACVVIAVFVPGIGRDKDTHVAAPRELNAQMLTGVWKQTRRESPVDPSPFEGSANEAWEKEQTWEEETKPWPFYLEFTPDGRMYRFFYMPEDGVQDNQSDIYTISGNTLQWSGWTLRYEAETDTICWTFWDRREYYERVPETEIVDPYRQKTIELRTQYPEYFGLDTSKGLKVYVWQMAGKDYSCALLSGTDERSEIEIGMMKGVTIEEMRLILSTYGLEEKDIDVVPFNNPISSYWYEIDNDYKVRIRRLVKENMPFTNEELAGLDSPPFSIDDVVCDVDGDGRLETCSLNQGPTSGLFTVVFTVYRNGTLAYRNTFHMDYGELTLNRSDNGLIVQHVIPWNDGAQIHVEYSVTIENGAIMLTEEFTGETVEYWGLDDPQWNMKGGA